MQAASPSSPASQAAGQRMQAESSNRKALALALAALDATEQRGEPARLAQALTNVAHCYHKLGMSAHRRWYLAKALSYANTLSAVDTSVDLLCELAESLVDGDEAERPDDPSGESDEEDRKSYNTRDQARDCLFQATKLAARSADPQWEVTVLMRASTLLDRMGDHDDAIAIQQRAVMLINRGVVQVEDLG